MVKRIQEHHDGPERNSPSKRQEVNGDIARDLIAGDAVDEAGSGGHTARRPARVGAGSQHDAGIMSGTNPPGKSETPFSGGALDGGDLAQGTGAGSAGGTADLGDHTGRSDEQQRNDQDTSRH